MTDLGSDVLTADPAEVVKPLTIAKVKKPLFSIGKTIKPVVVMAFSRQLSSFLEAGIPLLDALDIVAQQTASPAMVSRISDPQGWL